MTATLHSIVLHLLVPTFGFDDADPEVECSSELDVEKVRVTNDVTASNCDACLLNRRSRLERELGPNLETAT